ncbi:hypothetical protein GCM10025857_25410 [Alicyclobacillus contaminans]|nr:hypothetical protein GCM10025857_25410 [Alicyclobacillus contaminans]
MTDGSVRIDVPALEAWPVAALDVSDWVNGETARDVYLRYGIWVDGDEVSGGTVLFCKAKYLRLASPHLRCRVTEAADDFVIDVSADQFAKYVQLDLSDADGVFSDNYFDVSAGETRRILLSKQTLSRPLSLSELRDQLTVTSLVDTYSARSERAEVEVLA